MVITLISIASVLILLLVATYISMSLTVNRKAPKISLGGNMGYEATVNTVFKQDIDEGRNWINSLPFKEEWTTSYDGTKLYGRFYENPGSKITILMMHGFRSNALHDFSCAFQFYYDKGFNLMVPDQRAHGKSEGKYITYGVKERYDALAWLNHINTLIPEGTLYATGVSMGATTVLMAAGLELPENLKGIIADCGFTSPAEIIKKVMTNDIKLPLFPLYYTTRIMTRAFAGFDFEEYSAVSAVAESKVPILFLHGKEDGFVPFSMGEKIYDATSCEKKAVWVDGADHGCSFLVDREGCTNALSGFLGI